MEPSSSDTGFFQSLPAVPNQFYDDTSLQRVLRLLVPADVRATVTPDLAQLGADVLAPRIFDLVTDAERNLAYVRGGGRDAVGRPTSELVTGAGWRGLQTFGIEKGFVAYNYTAPPSYGAAARVLQMLRFHLWEASAACTTCPGAMTDGAARLLQQHLAPAAAAALDPVQRRVFEDAFARLTSRDPTQAWTSGQWMTERPGGSDVSQTETVARWAGDATETDANGLPLGPWVVDGFKWFSSATDAGMAVLLARTRPDAGLSAFVAPMHRAGTSRDQVSSSTTTRTATTLNGVRIQRLKDKFGTRPVPTAELELRGMRAWLVGTEGRGVREIATVLAITRVHCAVNCLGLIGRALAVARGYARLRGVRSSRTQGHSGSGSGRMLLAQTPLHMHTLAGLTGDYHGMMLLTLYTALVMGEEERSSTTSATPRNPLLPPSHLVAPLLRALSSLHKAYVCKQAVSLLHAAGMEALGGIGYLLNHESEPVNMARLFRDGSVNAIWEGTTDVLATDLVLTLKAAGRHGTTTLDALAWVVAHDTSDTSDTASRLAAAWDALRHRIVTSDTDRLVRDARAILFTLAELLIAVLLRADAHSDGDRATAAICNRFLVKARLADPETLADEQNASLDDLLALDTLIVYGPQGAQTTYVGAKL